MKRENIYFPTKITIRNVVALSKDVKLFELDTPPGFSYQPGQFAMVSTWGAGEVPISITSTPGVSRHLEFCIRSVGHVSRVLNSLSIGDTLWLRGPYGRPFPIYSDTHETLFICGGIGMVPLRPLINLVLADPDRRSQVSIIYGSRNPSEVLPFDEIKSWMNQGANVIMTVDTCDSSDWKGCTGLVTEHFGQAKIDYKNCTAYICGPLPMIHASMRDLSLMGMPDNRIITTLEAHMKCGVGKCGHCYCGGKLICEEGPVFSFEEIKKYRIKPGVDNLA